MRTNGFALFRGPDSRAAAEKASAKVQRHCEEVVAGPVASFEGWKEGADGEDGYVVAFGTERGRALPLVHGFLDEETTGGESVTGEFSMLRQGDHALFASRDRLGTRPLYLDAGGNVASDHRFFQDKPTLIPSGSTLEVGTTKLTNSGISVTRAGPSLDGCTAELCRLLKDAVARRVRGKRKVAVSFSGGLDSSIIALIASRETEVVLCSAYTSGSRDQDQAKRAADILDLDLFATEIDDASSTLELRSLDLPFEPTPMDRALWCIYSATAREAAKQGADLIVLGQLADELFGGYMKYARAAKESDATAAALMSADVVASGERAFIRDEEACARFTEVRFPFADYNLASFALGLPVEYKIAAGERKVILRRAAAALGLHESLATAPKKAAQYSSGVAKLVP